MNEATKIISELMSTIVLSFLAFGLLAGALTYFLPLTIGMAYAFWGGGVLGSVITYAIVIFQPLFENLVENVL
jgi:multidrug transporter EmrE-like cation transporter